MKLAVFGSRTLTDSRVEMELAAFLNEHPEYDTILTTQEPRGVCEVAQFFCKKNAIPLLLYFLNIRKYARSAFSRRSLQVIKDADFILLIHDGLSKGTANEYEEVKKAKKPHKYVVMTPTDKSIQREISVDILDREKFVKSDEALTLKI